MLLQTNLDLKILKEAIKNAKCKKHNSERTPMHCLSCVAGQYFFAAPAEDRRRFWMDAHSLSIATACATIYKLIDLKFKKNIYSPKKFEELCNYYTNEIHCKYPSCEEMERLISQRLVKI